MQATVEVRKLAWKRDPTVMQGIPAEGSYDCECGAIFYGGMFADGETHSCDECGLTVDSRGWIVGRAVINCSPR